VYLSTVDIGSREVSGDMLIQQAVYMRFERLFAHTCGIRGHEIDARAGSRGQQTNDTTGTWGAPTCDRRVVGLFVT